MYSTGHNQVNSTTKTGVSLYMCSNGIRLYDMKEWQHREASLNTKIYRECMIQVSDLWINAPLSELSSTI